MPWEETCGLSGRDEGGGVGMEGGEYSQALGGSNVAAAEPISSSFSRSFGAAFVLMFVAEDDVVSFSLAR